VGCTDVSEEPIDSTFAAEKILTPRIEGICFVLEILIA
jgi:hypothetical protein